MACGTTARGGGRPRQEQGESYSHKQNRLRQNTGGGTRNRSETGLAMRRAEGKISLDRTYAGLKGQRGHAKATAVSPSWPGQGRRRKC